MLQKRRNKFDVTNLITQFLILIILKINSTMNSVLKSESPFSYIKIIKNVPNK